MDEDGFAREVASARRRLEALERACDDSAAAGTTITEALQQLRTLLERLEVTGRELLHGHARREVGAEKALRESEQRLRTIISGVPVVLWAFDREGTFVLLEGRGLRNLERQTAFVGASVFEAYAQNPRVVECSRRVLAGEEFTDVVEVGGISFETKYFPIRDENGAVVGASGVSMDVTPRVRAERALRESEQKFKGIFNSSLDAIAINDFNDGCFLEVNDEFLQLTGYSREEVIGQTPAVLNIWAAAEDPKTVGRTIKSRGILRNVEASLRHKDGTTRWVLFSSVVMELGGRAGILSFLRDISERREAENALRELSGRLLQLQDEERRRIALELHDSTAQTLAALGLNLGLVRQSAEALNDRSRKALEESILMADQSLREVRTLSYLLHPPELEETGLSYAVRAYADGYAQRSGIRVKLEVPRRLQRLSREIETTLFRIVQESLTNIHRHSGSATATIRLRRGPREVTLEVRDRGRGIPGESLGRKRTPRSLGVGIPGMKERVRQLGGRLEIGSRGRGTSLVVTLPIDPKE